MWIKHMHVDDYFFVLEEAHFLSLPEQKLIVFGSFL